MARYIYGRNSVKASLRTNDVIEVYLKDDFNDKEIVSLVKERSIKYHVINQKELTKLANTDKHQGVVALIKDFCYSSLEEIIHASKKKELPLIVMLDGINDPHNFGAIIRSCAAFNVDGIIIKDRGQVQVTDVVSKTSAGTVNLIKIAKVTNLNNAIKELKEAGYWIYSTALHKRSIDYRTSKFDRPTVLVMGSEGDGVSRLVLENSDFLIHIPMSKEVESLNVSVATGIILSFIRK